MNLPLLAAAKARRGRLWDLLGGSAALIPAGSAPARNYRANAYPYRASSHFLYLVGLALPGAALWLGEEEHWLLLPERDALDALWHASGDGPEQLEQLTGLRVGKLDALPRLSRGRRVACPPLLHGHDAAHLSRLLMRSPERLGCDEELDGPLLDCLITLRLTHDEAAVHELRRAASLSVIAHRTGMQHTKVGRRESDVVAAMEAVFTREGFGTAYGSIVTTRGEVLHNHEHTGELRAGDLLLADVGAETETGYAADITRTWPVTGRFSATQREIYNVVLEAQRVAIAHVQPGRSYRDVHLAAARTLAQGLVEVGILRGSPDALVERGSHALFMPHGIGHLLGLDVHDMEDLGDRAGYQRGRSRALQFGLSYLRLDRDLVPGMLVTIEPGFYQVPLLLSEPEQVGLDLRDVDLDRLAQFHDVRGIRIEDDVLVTVNGCEVLTEALAKDPAEIEAAVQSGT